MNARVPRLIVGIAALVALASIPTPAFAAGGADDPQPQVISGQSYGGDPSVESLLVAAEERRLIEVRAISNAAGWTNVNQGRPYRLVTGNTYTLVLIRRDAPYTLQDLIEYAPSTFVRQPDGSYLLSENIVVEQGATLRLQSDNGLVIRMASDESAFVSIVTFGGSVELVGTSVHPLEISSWTAKGEVDTVTSDGRSYLRVVGGHAEFTHVEFHHLGFWSGSTGGVALTGTEVPEVLSDDETQNLVDEEEPAALVYGTELYPVDAESGLQTLALEPDLEGYSYVSAVIQDVVSRDNAFGMFITSADGVDIRDSFIENNLVDGLVLHRHVTNTLIRNTVARHNAVDGFSLTRATTGIVLDRVTAEANGRNGITIEGGPLAEGPSATGTPTGTYGNNQVSNSTISHNGRYGIDIVGGGQYVVDGNTISDHVMGVVASHSVDGVTITDNIIEDAQEQAIALREGVTDVLVQGNSIVGSEIGVYLRDAGGTIDRNTISGVSNHAVTLIDQSQATTVTSNIVSGSGPTAIDVARAGGDVTVSGNDESTWLGTKPLDVILRGIFQPLTVLWILLAVLLAVTAITSVRRRRTRTGPSHPYATQAPLASYSQGVVEPESLGLRSPRPAAEIPHREPELVGS
jgi:hypothetical protein